MQNNINTINLQKQLLITAKKKMFEKHNNNINSNYNDSFQNVIHMYIYINITQTYAKTSYQNALPQPANNEGYIAHI